MKRIKVADMCTTAERMDTQFEAESRYEIEPQTGSFVKINDRPNDAAGNS